MSTQRKQFVPHILPIVVGSVVRFPNQDPILHNAFSTSRDNAFDVGLYAQGEEQARSRSLTRATCASTATCTIRWSATSSCSIRLISRDPGADGHFKLTDLPDGRGDLVVWHDRAKPWHVKAVPGETAAVDVMLDLNLRRIPPHMNKFGKPYGRSGDAEY